MNPTNPILALAVAGLSMAANASVIDLDLISGSDSVTKGAPFGFDTYTESGFTITMDRAGDHIDRGFLGDLGFHNGPANPDNITWTLSFGGNAFSLLGVDVGGFSSGATSFTVTGSSGISQVISANGFNLVSLLNVTSVKFNIDQDGGIESVGLNGLRVDTAPSVPDATSTLGLLALGFAACVLGRKKLA